MACDVCRVKKVRCNNMLPCEYCKSHRTNCTYPPTSRKRKAPEPAGTSTLHLDQRNIRTESPIHQFVPSTGYNPPPSHHYDASPPSFRSPPITSPDHNFMRIMGGGNVAAPYSPPSGHHYGQYHDMGMPANYRNGSVGQGHEARDIPIDPALFMDPALLAESESMTTKPSMTESTAIDPSLTTVDPSLAIDPSLFAEPIKSEIPNGPGKPIDGEKSGVNDGVEKTAGERGNTVDETAIDVKLSVKNDLDPAKIADATEKVEEKSIETGSEPSVSSI